MAPADKTPIPEPFPHTPAPEGQSEHMPVPEGEAAYVAPPGMAVEPGSEEFPVAFRHYAASLQGTDDEVWTRYLHIMHGRRNMTMSEWQRAHHALRHEPAHWHRG